MDAPRPEPAARISFDPPVRAADASIAELLLATHGWSEARSGEHESVLTHAGSGARLRVLRAASVEVRLDSPDALASADVKRFVAALCVKLAERSRSSCILEGVDERGGGMRIVLAPPAAADEIRRALGRLDAGLRNAMEWVPPPDGRMPTYQDLVWASAAGRLDELVQQRALFEEEFGEIEAAYWPHHRKIGAAVVARRRRRRYLAGFRKRRTRLERIASHVQAGEWAEVLSKIDKLAVRAHYSLRGMSQRMAVERLFGIASEVYPHFDVPDPEAPPPEADADELKRRKDELDEIEKYIDQAAQREAPIAYMSGMCLGIGGLFVFVVLAWRIVSDVDLKMENGLLFGCLIAGAFGAILSVLQRLSADKIQLDIGVGRGYVRLLGAVRPFVGAVFGALLYLALAAGVISTASVSETDGRVAFFLTLAFVAGFSERVAKDMLKPPDSDR